MPREDQKRVVDMNDRGDKFHDLDDVKVPSVNSSDVDIGYDLFLQSERLSRNEKSGLDEREREWEADSKGVLRKIDLHVLPIMCIVYCLQYMDKQGLNYSNIFGLQQSLHLVGQQYCLEFSSWVSSIFYFGYDCQCSFPEFDTTVPTQNNSYLVAQYPLAWLMQRLPIARLLGILVFLWAVVLMSTAGVKDFTGAMINRFVLGCLEASVTYTSAEQPFRQLVWYSFQAWANTLGALIGYGVGHINAGLARWTYIYLILGAVTALFSVVVYFWLPDSPVLARFFSEQERIIAVKRVASNKTGIENKHFKWYQVKHALVDPKTYILFVLSLAAQIPNGLLTSFRSEIIQNMGFTVLQTTVLGIPSDFIQGYVASRVQNSRIIVMTIGNVTCIIAAACMAYLPLENNWGRLVAFWFTALQSIGFSLGLAMVSVNMGGYTKKAFMVLEVLFLGATIFIAYCVGNIIGPFFVFPDQAPRFISAIEAMLAGYVIKTAAGLTLGAYMLWDNRRRDRLQAVGGIPFDEHEGQRLSLLDRTEFVSKVGCTLPTECWA
ncbi:MFS general substrate transporter [Ramaria rubella]|nr:MFS general substrate transporter [Ramaria rubella]